MSANEVNETSPGMLARLTPNLLAFHGMRIVFGTSFFIHGAVRICAVVSSS